MNLGRISIRFKLFGKVWFTFSKPVGKIIEALLASAGKAGR